MIYIITYSSMMASSLITDRLSLSRHVMLFWVLVLFFFMGWREWTGCDFGSYMLRYAYYELEGIEISGIVSEPGFLIVNQIAIKSDLGYVGLNAILAALLLSSIAIFALKREAPVRYLALCFPIILVQLGMSGVRQATALAFLIFAFDAFANRQRINYILFVLLASTFHNSALIFSPLFFVINSRPTVFRLIIGTIFTLPFVFMLIGDRVDTYESRYGGGDVTSSGAIFRSALLLITALFFEYFKDRYQELFPKDFYLMQVFSIASCATFALLFISTIAAHRIGFYMMPIHLLILSRLPFVLGNGSYRLDLLAIPFVLYLSYIVVWFSLSRHARLCYLPYDNYLF